MVDYFLFISLKKHFKPCFFILRHFAVLKIRELENSWLRFLMSRTGYTSFEKSIYNFEGSSCCDILIKMVY